MPRFSRIRTRQAFRVVQLLRHLTCKELSDNVTDQCAMAHTKSRGFTLLETFIALVILGFALAGLAMMTIGNMQTGLEARRFSAAGALAQQKIEDLRYTGYAGVVNSTAAEGLQRWTEDGTQTAGAV